MIKKRVSSYSNTMVKGRIGYNLIGWPLIVVERARSDKPKTPVLCEVFGIEHESGSVYYDEIVLTYDLLRWDAAVRTAGFDPSKRYFKGNLIDEPNQLTEVHSHWEDR